MFVAICSLIVILGAGFCMAKPESWKVRTVSTMAMIGLVGHYAHAERVEWAVLWGLLAVMNIYFIHHYYNAKTS